MAMESPRKLFVYQLGITYDSEVASSSLLDFLAMRVQNKGFAQILRDIEKDKRRQLDNVGTCLEAVGLTPLQSTSPAEQGLRQRFEAFTWMQPSPEVLDLFALGVAVRSKHFSIIDYQELVNLAELLGEPRWAEPLRANLTTKRDSIARLEQCAAELRDRVFAKV